MEALILIAIFIALVAISTLVIKESERAVVFRKGKPNHVIGPGVYFVAPFFEVVKRVDMEIFSNDWRSLSSEELMRLLLNHFDGTLK
ncbi:MAG: SPFH domain-containing protein [Synechococcus sp.]